MFLLLERGVPRLIRDVRLHRVLASLTLILSYKQFVSKKKKSESFFVCCKRIHLIIDISFWVASLSSFLIPAIPCKLTFAHIGKTIFLFYIFLNIHVFLSVKSIFPTRKRMKVLKLKVSSFNSCSPDLTVHVSDQVISFLF